MITQMKNRKTVLIFNEHLMSRRATCYENNKLMTSLTTNEKLKCKTKKLMCQNFEKIFIRKS